MVNHHRRLADTQAEALRERWRARHVAHPELSLSAGYSAARCTCARIGSGLHGAAAGIPDNGRASALLEMRASTNIVLRVELNFDGTEMDLNLSDFGLAPSLLEELLPENMRIAQGIGPVLMRYSRTAGERHLSNGCIKCDRLQGSFFDHHVLYDMGPVHSGTGIVDKRWLKILSNRQPWH